MKPHQEVEDMIEKARHYCYLKGKQLTGLRISHRLYADLVDELDMLGGNLWVKEDYVLIDGVKITPFNQKGLACEISFI